MVFTLLGWVFVKNQPKKSRLDVYNFFLHVSEVRPSCESRSALSPMHVPHFGHHALSCKNGSDVVSRHNRIRDTLFEFCQLPASSCAPNAWVHSLKLEAVWVMKLNKHILLMSSSLTGSWASLLHLIFVSHPRLN